MRDMTTPPPPPSCPADAKCMCAAFRRDRERENESKFYKPSRFALGVWQILRKFLSSQQEKLAQHLPLPVTWLRRQLAHAIRPTLRSASPKINHCTLVKASDEPVVPYVRSSTIEEYLYLARKGQPLPWDDSAGAVGVYTQR